MQIPIRYPVGYLITYLVGSPVRYWISKFQSDIQLDIQPDICLNILGYPANYICPDIQLDIGYSNSTQVSSWISCYITGLILDIQNSATFQISQIFKHFQNLQNFQNLRRDAQGCLYDLPSPLLYYHVYIIIVI